MPAAGRRVTCLLPAIVLVALGAGASLGGAGHAGTTEISCLNPGVRHTGSTVETKQLCFTITRDGKLLTEARIGWGTTACNGDDLSLPQTSLTTVTVTKSGRLAGSFSVPFDQSVSGQIIGGGQVTVGIMKVSGIFEGGFQESGVATGTLTWTLRSEFGLRTVTCSRKEPATWTARAEVPSLESAKVASTPRRAIAGKLFSVRIVELIFGDGDKIVPPAESVTCSASLGHKAVKGTGPGGCVFRIPKTAGGKTLVVKLTVTYEGATKTTTAIYPVRRR